MRSPTTTLIPKTPRSIYSPHAVVEAEGGELWSMWLTGYLKADLL
jgi:hypothetical protein